MTLWEKHLLLLFLTLLGPDTGVNTLQPLLPSVIRRHIAYCLLKYRKAFWEKQEQLIASLTWENAGSIWAMDFTEPPAPVDGQYPWILVVRELGSGLQLASLPVEKMTSETTINMLVSLFTQHGRPLVLKSDNGSGLIALETRDFLKRQDVLLLLSPPGTPRFNGACEAGIGALKTRTHHVASYNDRPGHWTCDDIEGGRLMSNATSRPRGPSGDTPVELWVKRRRLCPQEQADFKGHVYTLRREILESEGQNEQLLTRAARDHIDRVAITRALLAFTLMTLKRRWISQPLNPRRRAMIS